MSATNGPAWAAFDPLKPLVDAREQGREGRELARRESRTGMEKPKRHEGESRTQSQGRPGAGHGQKPREEAVAITL